MQANGSIKSHPSSRGFALVVSLTLMVLLAVLAVGLLGLSGVSLRSSSQAQAQAEAQANARLALMLAIGELQKHAGPDTRVTAPAEIVNPEAPPLTGVWKSWEGTNHQASGPLAGRPIAPDYASKTKPAAQDGRFVSWLVSGPQESASSPMAAASLASKSPSAATVPLVSTGSLGKDDDRQVHLPPVMMDSESGALAWWVSGENQKARLPEPFKPKSDNAAGWAQLSGSHAVTDPAVFGLDALLADASPAARTFTRNTTDIFAKQDAASRPSQSFHDLSATSVGLLTNVATGGWRKDFSLLTENWDSQPSSGLEFFKISPTEHLKYTRPANAADYQPAKSMLYHWADYRDSGLREFWARRGPIASWAKIRSYATLYKKMTATSSPSRVPNINHQSWVDDGTPANAALTFHDIRLLPQMARIQIIASHYSTTQGAGRGRYRPAVLYTPLVTVWNPYNTRITLNGTLFINPAYALPLALRHKFTGAGAPALPEEYYAVQGGSSLAFYQNNSIGTDNHFHQDLRIQIGQSPMILEPGETRIFSPPTGSLQDVTATRRVTLNLSPGVRTGVGIFFTLDKKLQRQTGGSGDLVSLPGSVTMGVDAKFDVPSRVYLGRPVCGSAYQWFIDGIGSGRSHSWFQIFYEMQDADKLYPPKLGLASATLAQCADNPVPFLSMMLGSRIANFRATATKGVVQAEPVVDFFSSNGEPRFTDLYPGNDNLLNCPWDFSVVEHSSGGDDMLPNVDNSSNSSYIVTGVRKAEGVSRIVTAELPTRPLVSLADLTHMQIRGLNPTPPYTGNVVANSDASPLIPKDSVVNSADNPRANTRSNEQQDDSYCANHVLFDDWFFSSIAPEPAAFGPGGQSLRDNFIDFLTGKDPLANRSYRPMLEDATTDTRAANQIHTSHVAPADSWKTIASRLEVEGMFNVNSTSVKAWRALLGHARNHKIPYSRRDGSIELSAQTDYAFSRTSVSGDRKAGEAPQVAGEYADTTEFTGYRVFTDGMLDFLAEKIVEQVRLRGPFLSLSEFVNRQLSNDTNLALGGAIQTALNALTANSSLNPFKIIQNESVVSLASPFRGAALRDTGYVFPEAAVGHNTYGLPGWTRQADVLRPLAPILSARDDTFTIRAYGDSRDAGGQVRARAWCEATVQRGRDYVDSAEPADLTAAPARQANKTYGRQFKILSFRWLNLNEV